MNKCNDFFISIQQCFSETNIYVKVHTPFALTNKQSNLDTV